MTVKDIDGSVIDNFVREKSSTDNTGSDTATMQSPTPESTLDSSTVTFTWNPPAGADDFDLVIGTTGAGSSDIRASSVFNDTSMTVSGLPTDGRTVHVRLWIWINGWQYQDYTYQAVNITDDDSSNNNDGGDLDLDNHIPADSPPYSGTVWFSSEIITDADPSAFVSYIYKGQANRTMFDRRTGWTTYYAYLFDVQFGSTVTLEFMVNPEFSRDDAEVQVQRYALPLGKIPAFLFQNIKEVYIHRGDIGLGGGSGGDLTIHTDRAERDLQDGVLEEEFIHEAAHITMDAYYLNSSGWQVAMNADGMAISQYALDNPDREDFAESLGPYLGYRFRANRLNATQISNVENTIPYRVTYLDSLNLSMDILDGGGEMPDDGGNGGAAITETTITSPSSNSVFQIGDTINVAVDAQDPDGVAAVRLWVNNTYDSIANSSPYEFTVTGLSPGAHTLMASAEDVNGAATDSEVITVIVEEDQNPNDPNDPMQSPIPGSTLNSSTVTFTWNRPAGADDFDLIIGTTGAGSSDIRSSSVFNDTSMTVSGLPADGRTVYVRLWTWINDWQYQDYTYQAVDNGDGGNGGAAITETTITSPSNNSVFQIGDTINVAVDAQDPDGVAAVRLRIDEVNYDIDNTSPFSFSVIGLTPGTHTLMARAEDVNGVATDSEVITVIVEEVIDQNPNDPMQSPIPGSTLNSSTVTFTWNRPAGADDFDLIIGTTGAGSSDIRSSSVFNDTSMTVSGLPADGRTVYVRLWTWINDWQYQDYTYQAANGTAETPSEDNAPEEPNDSPPANNPQGVNYNFYFGHLHEHTQFSDGDGTPEDMFMEGIWRGLDFMAASDHGYSISSSEAYDTASVADEYYSPGTFTTFASEEASDGDHIGVHDEDHSVLWFNDNYGHNYADMYDDMAAHGAVGVFHHPDRYGSYAFGGMGYNATGDQVMTMMEIANKGDIEDSHYYLWIEALDKGWHIAPAAGDDNHSARLGT